MVAIQPQSMTRCTPTNNNFIFHRFDHKTNTSKDIIRLESRDAVGARGVPDPSGFPDQGDGGCTLGFFPENRNIDASCRWAPSLPIPRTGNPEATSSNGKVLDLSFGNGKTSSLVAVVATYGSPSTCTDRRSLLRLRIRGRM